MQVGYSRKFASGPPLGNLTAQWDASDTTKVWNVLNHAVNPCWATQATDGQLARVWQSTVPGLGVETPLVIEAAGREPTYEVASSPMLLPSLHFVKADNDDMLIRTRDDGAQFMPLSDYLGLSAKTILISLQVHVSGGYVIQVAATDAFGIFVYAPGAVETIEAFNRRSGGTDVNDHPISLDTNYVFMMRHDGVNLKSSLNGGTELSIASGASTPSAPDTMRVGTNGASPSDISVGEILLYNSYLTGADLTAALDYMTGKWL